MITSQQQEIVLRHLQALKPVKVAIFGSYARGENNPYSDLDVLIHLDYRNNISLLDLAGVEQDISDALGFKVDLVTDKSLSRHIRPYVEKDLKYILE